MGRPVDWSPLAEADPVPGDPYEVAVLGRRLRETAREIESAARRLRTMCTDEFWDSGAGEAFRQRSVAVAGKLAAAFGRYDAAARALGADPADASPSTAARPNYSGVLDQAQAASLRALGPAQDAATTQRVVMSRLGGEYGPFLAPGALVPGPSGHLRSPVPLLPLPAGSPAAAAEVAGIDALVRRYNAAADAIGASRSAVARAQALRDEAAANAAGLINSVIGSDGLTDSFWDQVTNFIDEHAGLLKAISGIAGWVATVTGTLALVVGWVPVVGQALAAVLGTVALAASVLTLISDALLEIGGEGSWFDLAGDVIAVGSFGLGRAAVGALKDSALLARVSGRVEEFTGVLRDAMSSVFVHGGEEALDEMLPGAWKATSEEFDLLDEGEIRTAREHAPGSWPKWGDIRRGFHPRSILRDGFKDVSDLKLANWKALLEGKTWKGVKPFIGDPEIHEALESLEKIEKVADEPPVKAYLAKVASNHSMWRYVTTPAVATDFTNHFLTETGWKDGFLHDVGLGWAAGAGG